MNDIALLKVGTKYTSDHVNRLVKLLPNHRVLCFTDNDKGLKCASAPLPLDQYNGVEGWWWKLWLFSMQPWQLYLDLDVTPVGDVGDLMAASGWRAIKDPWQKCLNTSVVKIGVRGCDLWRAFLHERPDRGPRAHLGDQDFFTRQIGETCSVWLEDWVVSYKHKILGKGNPKGPEKIPKECRMVYYHGQPKPWDGEEHAIRK